MEQRILAALAGHRVLAARQLERETGLERRELLDALAALMDAGELRTNPAGEWWRPVERCARCERLRADGVPVIFCSGCRFHERNG